MYRWAAKNTETGEVSVNLTFRNEEECRRNILFLKGFNAPNWKPQLFELTEVPNKPEDLEIKGVDKDD